MVNNENFQFEVGINLNSGIINTLYVNYSARSAMVISINRFYEV